MPMSAFDSVERTRWKESASRAQDRRERHRTGIGIALEERRRDDVDALVGGLRREDRRASSSKALR
jgi:hypothetical protein